MAEPETAYNSPLADSRLLLQIIGVRWALTGFYVLFAFVGIIDVGGLWFAFSAGYLIAYHIAYTWYTLYDLNHPSFSLAMPQAFPFLDTVAITLALVAIGDPLHPIWGVYFFVIVAVVFFYQQTSRHYLVWLTANYAALGFMLHLRGFDVPIPHMVVTAVILIMGLYNVAAYTSGERRLRHRISEVARTDPLTNLLNRRGLEEALSRHLETAPATEQGLAVLMVDVDRFKRYNDQYGHIAADGVLEQLADQLSAAVREQDLVARYGGDEFVVILPNVGAHDARQMAERLRQQVARLGLCTVSVGVSVSQGPEPAAEQLLDLADTVLLSAKQAGRNCVKVAMAPAKRAA